MNGLHDLLKKDVEHARDHRHSHLAAELVWVGSALYLGPFALALYARQGRTPAGTGRPVTGRLQDDRETAFEVQRRLISGDWGHAATLPANSTGLADTGLGDLWLGPAGALVILAAQITTNILAA